MHCNTKSILNVELLLIQMFSHFTYTYHELCRCTNNNQPFFSLRKQFWMRWNWNREYLFRFTYFVRHFEHIVCIIWLNCIVHSTVLSQICLLRSNSPKLNFFSLFLQIFPYFVFISVKLPWNVLQHNTKHVNWFFSLLCVCLCVRSGALVVETPSTGSLFKIHIYLIACNLFKLRFNYPLIYIRTYIHACNNVQCSMPYICMRLSSCKLQIDDKVHLNRKLLTFAEILFEEEEKKILRFNSAKKIAIQ